MLGGGGPLGRFCRASWPDIENPSAASLQAYDAGALAFIHYNEDASWTTDKTTLTIR